MEPAPGLAVGLIVSSAASAVAALHRERGVVYSDVDPPIRVRRPSLSTSPPDLLQCFPTTGRAAPCPMQLYTVTQKRCTEPPLPAPWVLGQQNHRRQRSCLTHAYVCKQHAAGPVTDVPTHSTCSWCRIGMACCDSEILWTLFIHKNIRHPPPAPAEHLQLVADGVPCRPGGCGAGRERHPGGPPGICKSHGARTGQGCPAARRRSGAALSCEWAALAPQELHLLLAQLASSCRPYRGTPAVLHGYYTLGTFMSPPSCLFVRLDPWTPSAASAWLLHDALAALGDLVPSLLCRTSYPPRTG